GGQGGKGGGYRALGERVDRRICIKGGRLGYRNRLPPETRAAREVSHFNVCKVYELHTVQLAGGELDFLTMEFIDGQTVAARLRSPEPLKIAEVRDIVLQLAAGLAQAHRQGVVHGDLKPANIILARTREGRVRA